MNAFATLSLTPDTVRVAGKPLDLTAMEYALLRALVATQANAGRDMTTLQALELALDEAFPQRKDAASNVTQVMLSRIRRKLRDAQAGVDIQSVRGRGYMLRAALPEPRA
jgi:DNA-binding response OmpR family regulator